MNIPGTPNSDVLYGTSDPDTITGEGGDDKLFAFGGDDTLDGGDGSDLLDGGQGADTMTGGTGNDYYYVDNLGDIVNESIGGGSDLVFTSISYILPGNVKRLAVIDPNGTAPLTLTGNALNNEIIGNAGNNILIGNGGADLLRGEGGDDTYIVTSQTNFGEHAGGGYDIVYFDAQGLPNTFHDTFDFTLKRPIFGEVNYIEQLSVYDRTSINTVNLQGSAQNDVLTGNDGTNFLDGGVGIDTMSGYGGNDYYFIDRAADIIIEAAGEGYDTVILGDYARRLSFAGGYTLPENFEQLVGVGILNGNRANNEVSATPGTLDDTINGGDGQDKLIGYGGHDTFVFNSAPGAANADWIVDFSYENDIISLDHTVFTGLQTGTLAANEFHVGKNGDWQAQDADDHILYDYQTGKLYFDPDGNGAAEAQWFATVDPRLDGLTASVFHVF